MLPRRLVEARWAAALHYPAFRWLLLGRLASSATIQMRNVAQGWLVYDLTESALALTWVGAARAVVMFVFSLFGGMLSDRFPKRWVMFWCRWVLVVSYTIVGILVLTGRAQVWHIAAGSMVDGLVFAFMVPAQGSISAELVDRKDLVNALSVLALAQGLMSVIASAGAGLMIDAWGAWGVYFGISALYAFVAFTLTRLPDGPGVGRAAKTSPLQEIGEGLRYLSTQPVLISALGMRLVRTLLYMPYRSLLPAFVEEVLGMGATGLGLMLSISGVGGLLASAALTVYGERLPKGKLLIGTGIAGGLALILLVTLRTIPFPYVWILVAGATGNLSMVLVNAVIQTRCEPEFRGRVSGVRMMLMGMSPLGSLPAGALSDMYGSEYVIGVQGLLLMLSFGLIGKLRPELRKIK